MHDKTLKKLIKNGEKQVKHREIVVKLIQTNTKNELSIRRARIVKE